MPVVSAGRGHAPVAYGPCRTARLLYLPAVSPGPDHAADDQFRIMVSQAAELVKRPFPCQFRAATWREATTLLWAAVAVSPGESLCGVVAVNSAVTGLPVVAGLRALRRTSFSSPAFRNVSLTTELAQ